MYEISLLPTSKSRILGLKDLCKSLLTRTICVEIGCFAGVSTQVLARHFHQVYAIDPWSQGIAGKLMDGHHVPVKLLPPDMTLVEEPFDQRMAPYKNVTKIRAFDFEVLDQFADKSLDFVYIDSIHTYQCVIETIHRWLPKLKSSGAIGGHDYSQSFPGVRDVVDELFGGPTMLFQDLSWLVKMSK